MDKDIHGLIAYCCLFFKYMLCKLSLKFHEYLLMKEPSQNTK